MSARDDPARAQDGCRGDAAVHLLGLLDERQSSEFLEHARSCALCSDDLAALSPAVDSLPGTVPQLPAPERTRRQVMAVVRSEASLMSAGSSRPVKARPPLGRWRRGPALALAGAGVLAAGVALGGLSTPFGGGTAQRGAVQRGAGIRVVSADVALPGASATLNQSAGHTWLAVSRMPEPAAGHVYEVWIERPGNKAPQPTTSLFAPTSAGAATVEVPIGQGTGTVMVTQEPLGGSPQPTGRVVIVAHVT